MLIEDGAAARSAVFGPGSALGRGGMESKVAAAEVAAGPGIPTVIAGGAGEGVLHRHPRRAARRARASPRRSRRPRSSSGCGTASASPRGSRVDAGAQRAVVDGGGSLLAVGVTGWDVDFRAGDGVELVGPDGAAFARGIASVDASELAGKPVNVEAVHRDRLVLT